MYLNKAMNLFEQFKRSGREEDLEEAIQHAKSALLKTISSKSLYIEKVNLLGVFVKTRSSFKRAPGDLEEAIGMFTKAVEVTPNNDPALIGYLNNLGCGLEDRYELFGHRGDLEDAIWFSRPVIIATPASHCKLGGRLSNLRWSEFYTKVLMPRLLMTQISQPVQQTWSIVWKAESHQNLQLS
ncbi:hypothetical protein RU639_001401 [Aspergillus parasiticus]